MLDSTIMKGKKISIYYLCRFCIFCIFLYILYILALRINEKQNSKESSTNKHQKHVACSYCYKLVCVDNKVSKYFKSYSGEDDVNILLIV